jgi:GNAT superfamily N-acetyltransferase
MSSLQLFPLIRDAVAWDCPAIVEFNRLLAIETEGKVLDASILDRGVARALADPARLRDWRNGWIWWLQSVYIHTDFRGRGIFKALYRHIHQEALAESNVIGLRLYVENGNVRAQQTYQALGMKPGGYSVLEELWLDRSRLA